MTTLSKLVDRAVMKYEEKGYSKLMLSNCIVGATLVAYGVRVTYPLWKKYLFDENSLNDAENNNKTKETDCDILNSDDGDDDDDTVLTQVNNLEVSTISGAFARADPNDWLTRLANYLQKRSPSKNQPGLNIEFILQLRQLLRIMVPRLVCRETGILGIHTLCLVVRTFLSIYVAAMEGAIVKFIVRKDFKNFSIMLLKWIGIALPATFINSMIRFLENKLALAFRTRLVNHSYRLYFKNQTYYRVSNLDGRIENADHRLTEDISVFTSSVAHLYSHLTKPCFDLMLIGLTMIKTSKKMRASVFHGPMLGFAVIASTAHVLRLLSPKFGQLVSEEANRYGYLRHIHSRIITNAEEIAFYGGHKVELIQLRDAYNKLTRQMNLIFTKKLWYIMMEQFFMKYVWSGTGMVMISLPILFSTANANTELKEVNDKDIVVVQTAGISERTEYLTTARNLLLSASDAVERLMSSYKEIVELAGYTDRVAGMLTVFEETSKGIYRKTIVAGSHERNTAGILEFDKNDVPMVKGKVMYSPPNISDISLIDVPVVTPNCDIVVPSLTLHIKPGTHLLITGPNGCGKSSLFRILSGLWPIYGGELHIPKPVEGKPCMFYIPQRPYMSIGSLRDQIIYPDTREDMRRKNIDEQNLRNILKMVTLENIATRDGFDVIKDWKDILSGGEKQRMAIARLFYHKPQYALLDECTSAVSIDVESSMYESAKEMGITLMTITHRPTLWKFHTHILEFDGMGGWDFREIDRVDDV